ncbi:Ig-like domain-containing protein [Fibrobacterota bacterium]
MNTYTKKFVFLSLFLLLAGLPSFGINLMVDDFSAHLSGISSDTSKLASDLGDTLKVGAQYNTYVFTFRNQALLCNRLGNNGASAANPVVVNSGGRNFKIAYLAWPDAHSAQTAAIYNPPQANIVVRTIAITEASASFSEDAEIIAGMENPTDNLGIFYTEPDFRPPPSYLSFAAEGSSYAAYWSTLKLSGSVRRTSDNDAAGKTDPTQYGEYVPEGTPDVLTGYYGTLGMGARPGSNADKVVLAYEMTSNPASARVRWEDLEAGTTSEATINRPSAVFMRDFAVAVDSAGNAMIMWREGNTSVDTLYGAAYSESMAQIMAPTQLVSGSITVWDYPNHTYRLYGAAALDTNEFVITYSKGASVFYNTVDILNPSPLGTEVELTPGSVGCYHPDVAVSNNYIVFSWYGGLFNTSGNIFPEGTLFQRSGTVINTASRFDTTLYGSQVTFDVGQGWAPWHNTRVPNVAVNDFGDMVVVFDHNFEARMGCWKKSNIYHDTAIFISNAVPLENPDIGYTFDASTDSAEILSVSLNPSAHITMELSLSRNSDFDQPSDAFFPVPETGSLTSTVKGDFAYLKYKLALETVSLSNTSTPVADSLKITYNIKPHPAVIDSLELGNAGTVAYNSLARYDLLVRRDSLRIFASAFDPDNQSGLSFTYAYLTNEILDHAPAMQGDGTFRSSVNIPVFHSPVEGLILTITAEDSLGWKAEPESLSLNYLNVVPEVSAEFIRNRTEVTAGRDTLALEVNSISTATARDTALLNLLYYDQNDTILQIRILVNDKSILDSMVTIGENHQLVMFSDYKMDSVKYEVLLVDPDTVTSTVFYFDYINQPPGLFAELFLNRGGEVGGRYDPSSGGADTLVLQQGSSHMIHADDTARARLVFFDPGEDSLDLEVFKDGSQLVAGRVAPGDTLFFELAGEKGQPASDYVIRLRDADTAIDLAFEVEYNHSPVLDSLLCSVQGSLFDRVTDLARDTGILINLRDTMELDLYYSDFYSAEEAVPSIELIVMVLPEDCSRGKLDCYDSGAVYSGTEASHLFLRNHPHMLIRLTDSLGAFSQYVIAVEYPYLDTSEANKNLFQSSLEGLNSSEPFVLSSDASSRRDTITVSNMGTGLLEIDSVFTRWDNSEWLTYELRWNSPLQGPRSILVDGATDLNNLPDPITLAQGNQLSVMFYFFSDSLKGDSLIQDTLYIHTNDLNTPLLSVPFQFRYIDLPTVAISTITGLITPDLFKISQTGDDTLQADQDTLLSQVNRQTSIIFAFSEPVLDNTIDTSTIRIYSALDSAKRGYSSPIESYYPEYFDRVFYRTGSPALVDSLVFSPRYTAASDSLGVRPLPGSFVPGDIIRIHVSNQITDSAGNALDLSLAKIVQAPGSDDSVFTLTVDNSYLRVVSTEPEDGSNTFDPENPIEIHFNSPLVYDYLHPGLGTRIISVDTANLLASDSNRTVRITSVYNQGSRFNLRSLTLANGDTTLLIKLSPNFFSGDTVTVTIFNNVADTSGLTLDGNSDGQGMYLFDTGDTDDHYTFTFVTGRKQFYVYPNPFKWSDQDHSRKNSMTFANLSGLKGARAGKIMDFRIYTMTGDLVYSSKRMGTSLTLVQNTTPTWDWNLRNNKGNRVATGVYLYAVSIKPEGLVKKGKLAVIR